MKLTNPELIVKRSYKEVYKDGDKIVKIFEKDHPKSAVFNEALNTVRVEEAGLDIPKLDEVTQIDENGHLLLSVRQARLWKQSWKRIRIIWKNIWQSS